MSERTPKVTPNTETLASEQAAIDAIAADLQEQQRKLAMKQGKLDRAVSFGKYDVTVPAEGEVNYADYLAQRPDGDGAVHRDEENGVFRKGGRFASEAEYREQNAPNPDQLIPGLENNQGEAVGYSELSTTALVKAAVEARARGDIADEKEIHEIVADRMETSVLNEKDGYKNAELDGRLEQELQNFKDRVSALEARLTKLETRDNSTAAVDGAEEEVAVADTTPEDDTGDDAPISSVGKELVPYETKGKELVVFESEDKEPKERPKFEFEASEDQETQVERASRRYAEETAKSRKSLIGQFLRDSKYLVKIPGLKAAAEWVNDKVDAPLDQSREVYREQRDELEKALLSQFEEFTADKIDNLSEQELATLEKDKEFALFSMRRKHDASLSLKISEERQRISGKTNKLNDWYHQRKGGRARQIAGAIGKKIATSGTAGFAAGLAVGVVAGPLVAGVAGAAAGAAAARYFSNRRANARNEEKEAIAVSQAKEDDGRATRGALDGGEYKNAIEITEERTAKEQRKNREKVVAGAVTGFGAGVAGESVGDALFGSSDTVGATEPEKVTGDDIPNREPLNEAETPVVPEADVPSTEFEGYDGFDIQPGSGFTQELMDLANVNGYDLSPNDAWDLHNELLGEFGTYIQDAAGNPIDTYSMGSNAAEIGISAPGKGSFSPEVAQFIENWIKAKG